MKKTINIKSKFKNCQQNSDGFRFNELKSKEDVYNTPFLINSALLPNIQKYELSFFDDLAEAKKTTKKEMFETYWNKLSEKYNSSSANIETDKAFIKSRLEKELFPTYFTYTQIIFTHYFEQSYSSELYKTHKEEIVHIVSSFYIGDTKALKKIIEKGIVGKEYFDKHCEVSSDKFCIDAYGLVLNIWDEHFKLLHFIEFPRRSYSFSERNKYPVKKVYNYSTENGQAKKDRRGKHKEAEIIIPEKDFWDEARKLFKEEGDRCISSRDSSNSSSFIQRNLAGETTNKQFFGYMKKDKNKSNPKKLRKGKIGTLLNENPTKWRL